MESWHTNYYCSWFFYFTYIFICYVISNGFSKKVSINPNITSIVYTRLVFDVLSISFILGYIVRYINENSEIRRYNDQQNQHNNPNSNNSNQFILGVNNSIQLDKGMVGGDFVINDAFEIMDLTTLNRNNDGFEITIGGKGANRHYGPGDEGYINRGDQDPSNNIEKSDTFRKIAKDLPTIS